MGRPWYGEKPCTQVALGEDMLKVVAMKLFYA